MRPIEETIYRGFFLVFAMLGCLLPMPAGAQPEVRVIVYVESSLLARIESPSGLDAWLQEMKTACDCPLESVGPAPGKAWVLSLPQRPDQERLDAFLDCLQDQPRVKGAESDQLLQPADR